MKKKILAFLLAVIMVIGLVPMTVIPVAAAGNVAKIDGKGEYTSLSAAITAAVDGDTIKLLDNISENQVTFIKNITLDLNGKTITGTNGSLIEISSSEIKLTITDSVGGGNIITGDENGLFEVTGEVTILDGTYTLGNDSDFYNFYNPSKKGKITIKGGTFNFNPSMYDIGGDGKIVDFVHPDYKSVANGDDTWTVKSRYVAQIGEGDDAKYYETLADAIEAVPEGVETTIVMIGDDTYADNVNMTIAATQNIILDLNGKTVTGKNLNVSKWAFLTNNGTLKITDTSANKDGKITSSTVPETDGYAGHYTVLNKNVMTLEAGVIEETSEKVGGGANLKWALRNEASANQTVTLNITGGTVLGEYNAISNYVNNNSSTCNVNISGGQIITTGRFSAMTMQIASGTKPNFNVNISGGEFIVENIRNTNASGNAIIYCDEQNSSVTDTSNIKIDITGGKFDTFNTAMLVQFDDFKEVSLPTNYTSAGYFKVAIEDREIVSGKTCVKIVDMANPTEADNAAKDAGYIYMIGKVKVVVPSTEEGQKKAELDITQISHVDETELAKVITDETTAEEVKTNTKVTGVELTTEGTKEVLSGVQKIVEDAIDKGEKNAMTDAEEVKIDVDVKVIPTVYVAPVEVEEGKTEGMAKFKLTPTATVSVTKTVVGSDPITTKVATGIEVTNDMIDTTKPITVQLYTGFEPKLIVHTSDDGTEEKFTKDGTNGTKTFTYNNVTGTATLTIAHFSYLTAYYTETDNIVEEAKIITGASVLLNSNVSVRFYLADTGLTGYTFGYVKSADGAKDAIHYTEKDGAYVIDKDYYIANNPKATVVPNATVQSNIIDVDGGTNTQYYIDIPVCAREFADNITIVVTKDGKEVETRVYSVKTYCENRIAKHNNEPNNATRKLAMAMLDYGTEMQKYKIYNTQNLANSVVLSAYNQQVRSESETLSEEYKKFFGTTPLPAGATQLSKLVAVDAVNSTTYDNPTKTMTQEQINIGVRSYGKSLSLEDNVKVYFYFAVGKIGTTGGTLENIDYTTFTFTDEDDTVLPVKCADQEKNIYYVVADGLAASELEKQYTVIVKANEGNKYNIPTTSQLEVKFSPLEYCAAMKNNETVGSLCKTIVNYWNAAEAVFEPTND